jgi:hypothetical protein
MKTWAKVALSIIAVGAGVVYAMRIDREHGTAQRTVAYQTKLASFRRDFPSGMSRSMVESKLRAKEIAFSHELNSYGSHTYSDDILIGHEPSPWYCSHHNVYLSIEFNGQDPKDQLRVVILVHRFIDCL